MKYVRSPSEGMCCVRVAFNNREIVDIFRRQGVPLDRGEVQFDWITLEEGLYMLPPQQNHELEWLQEYCYLARGKSLPVNERQLNNILIELDDNAEEIRDAQQGCRVEIIRIGSEDDSGCYDVYRKSAQGKVKEEHFGPADIGSDPALHREFAAACREACCDRVVELAREGGRGAKKPRQTARNSRPSGRDKDAADAPAGTTAKSSRTPDMWEKIASLKTEEDKLRTLSAELQRRYADRKAATLRQVKDENKDLPITSLSVLAGRVYGETAKQCLVRIGVVK
ncbi:MAG: hypothetical protein ACOX41_03340 [Anaerovoracaceae bacterium]|jgi:hypothetical protein